MKRSSVTPRRLGVLAGLLAAVGIAVGAVVLARDTSSAVVGSERPQISVQPVWKGIWISYDELRRLPRSGAAWRRLKATADASLGTADMADPISSHDVRTLAAALVFARTKQERYRTKAAAGIANAIGTEREGTTLALGRNLVSYVIAADLINLPRYDPTANRRLRAWLREVREETLDGRTLIDTHETRPNNWGTMAGASRVAVDAYLGDTENLARAATVFRGWLGDRSAYSGFRYGGDDDGWQVDPDRPVGVIPTNAVKQGYSIDGALPSEMRRGGSFRFPPKRTSYPWGGLSGALVLAELLHRQGYDAWSWEDQALRRAAQFLYDLDRRYGKWWASGDDTWQPWLLNFAYDSRFPTSPAVLPGKNMAWTDWTHARGPRVSSETRGSPQAASTSTGALAPSRLE